MFYFPSYYSNLYAVDGKPGSVAGLFERVAQSIKVKHYSEAINDLNAAIEADPTLSEAYYHRGSVLRQLCRFSSPKNLLYLFYNFIFKSKIYFVRISFDIFLFNIVITNYLILSNVDGQHLS